MGFRSGDFRFSYENDGAPFSGTLGDGNDSYRTAAASIGIGKFSAGFNIFTGERNLEAEKELPGGYKGIKGTNFKDSFGRNIGRGPVIEKGTKYRLGAAYFGYKGFKVYFY